MNVCPHMNGKRHRRSEDRPRLTPTADAQGRHPGQTPRADAHGRLPTQRTHGRRPRQPPTQRTHAEDSSAAREPSLTHSSTMWTHLRTTALNRGARRQPPGVVGPGWESGHSRRAGGQRGETSADGGREGLSGVRSQAPYQLWGTWGTHACYSASRSKLGGHYT